MARPDLMALTADDLVTLTNRGIVKRAQQEIETMTGACSENDAGDVHVAWVDEGVDCVIPSKGGVPAATCTCPATTLCRHIVRSVFAYQRKPSPQPPPLLREGEIVPDAPTELMGESAAPLPLLGKERAGERLSAHVWDPGAITDEQLAEVVHKTLLAKARRLFDSGQVVELVRAAKPTARVHSLSSNVRFLVPGDLRYTYCDCAETQPCTHVPLAIWAFRLLDAASHSGVVSTHKVALPVPVDVLDDVENAAREMVVNGFSNLSQSEVVRWRRIEDRLRENGLAWPAEIASELVSLHDAYVSGDARYVASRIPELVGELLVRADAIRNDTGAVPQLFIRGSSADRTTDIGSARLIGLGCGVHVRRRAVQLSAYLQDMDSGMIVAVTRLRSDPENGDPARTFAALALGPVVKGSNLHNLGFGQLLIKGGKRTASGEFLPGRSPVTYSPQAYRWESLRPPLYAEDFDELAGRLEAQPPASLMPRRVGAKLSVCAVEGIESDHFDNANQSLEAVVVDRGGRPARLSFPYYVRNEGGFERLSAYLADAGARPKFISGEFRVGPSGLQVDPIAVVFERNGVREMVQPWVDAGGASDGAAYAHASTTALAPTSPTAAVLDDVLDALADIYGIGLTRVDNAHVRTWRDLSSRASATGLDRIAAMVECVASRLDTKASAVDWDANPVAQAIVDLTVVTRVAVDLL